jgi:thioredoxin
MNTLKSSIFFSLLIGFLYSCSQAQSTHQLDAKIFYEKIKDQNSIPIIDVRTPQEFAGGHIKKAININWNEEGFLGKIKDFEKSKPIYVYCLSGGRSGTAASEMRKMGFMNVYELNGGMMSWRSFGLPEESNTLKQSETYSINDITHLTQQSEFTLLNFHAEWCGPCKKMQPFIEKLSKELEKNTKVIRIDADVHKNLCTEYKIENIPTLLFFHKGKLLWKQEGFISEQELKAKMKI